MSASGELDRALKIRSLLPEGGLFHEKTWRISPRAFPVDERLADELEKLGHRLLLFVRACNLLYRLSVDGRQPRWIHELLDRGKPRQLVELSREKAFKDEIPRILRPDLILTPDGFAIAELDNVPGGIGVTGWLSQTYAALGEDVVGGPRGMVDGFASILPGADIVVSEEAATYRSEMEWLAEQCNQHHGREGRVWRVVEGSESDLQPHIYRFFELFDLPNIPVAGALAQRLRDGQVEISPPWKPWLEEKLWFALFWLKPLRDFWRRELSDRHFRKLQEVIPYSWVVDPSPLPVHAVLPRLEIQNWDELGKASQKERDLVLKISGFSELAWGSRGVTVGRDVSQMEWRNALESALKGFGEHPYVLQEFRHSAVIEHPVLDDNGKSVTTMKSRARLCPYYFIRDNKAQWGGTLATLVPVDKKLIHGMSDGMMLPGAFTVSV